MVQRNKFISVSPFYFSTLYTNIPHHELKSVNLWTFKDKELENNYSYFYPDELGLNKKNKYPCKLLRLDPSTEVRDRKFTN